jgi:hypothetical protein
MTENYADQQRTDNSHYHPSHIWKTLIHNIPSNWLHHSNKGKKKMNQNFKNPKKDVYDRYDCLFSSFLCNCCQFSCYIPHQETYCSYQPNPNVPAVPHSRHKSHQVSLPKGTDATNTNNPCDSVISSANDETMVASTSNWMERLIQLNDTIVLKDIIIPGSHHSASYSIPNFRLFSAIAKTQNLSIKQQLNSGIRYLDIRLAPTKDQSQIQCNDDNSSIPNLSNISVWHGSIQGSCTLETVLLDIQEFCCNYTSECIIIEFVPEHGHVMTKEQKRICLDTILSVLDTSNIIPASKIKECITSIPLKSVIETNYSNTILEKHKQHNIALELLERQRYRNKSKLILLLHDRFFENDFAINEIMNHKECFNLSSYYVANKWHNIHNSMPLLFNKNVTHLNRYQQFPFFICNQFIITPNINSLKDIICFLLGIHSLRPISWSCRMYQTNQLDQFLASSIKNIDQVATTHRQWNILLLDYIDLCPDILDFVISLNFHNFRSKDQIDVMISSSESMISKGSKSNVVKSKNNLVSENSVVNSKEDDAYIQKQNLDSRNKSMIENEQQASSNAKATNGDEYDAISSPVDACGPVPNYQTSETMMDGIASYPINLTAINEEQVHEASVKMSDRRLGKNHNDAKEPNRNDFLYQRNNTVTTVEDPIASTTMDDECVLLLDYQTFESKVNASDIELNKAVINISSSMLDDEKIVNGIDPKISSTLITNVSLCSEVSRTEKDHTESLAGTITTNTTDVASKTVPYSVGVPDRRKNSDTPDQKVKSYNAFQIHMAVIESNEIVKPKNIVDAETGEAQLLPPPPRPGQPFRKQVPAKAVNQLIYRDCVLYVPNPMQEWNIPPIKHSKEQNDKKKYYEIETILTLTIGFSLVDRVTSKTTYYVATIPLSSMNVKSRKCSTWPIIFCPYYCINDGAFVVALKEDDLNTGVIVHGVRKYKSNGSPPASSQVSITNEGNATGGNDILEYKVLDESTEATTALDNYGSKLCCTLISSSSNSNHSICRYQLVAEKTVKLLIFPSST